MGWGEQDVIITVAVHAGVDVVDDTAVAAVLEDFEEFIAKPARILPCYNIRKTNKT